jgi:hypothetical protein
VLALVAVAGVGLATGLWGVGGAGAKTAGTITITSIEGTTTFTATITTPDTTTLKTTTEGTTTQTPPPPEFASFVPASGSPGTSIVIRGNGFTGTTAVSVNGANATFTVNSDFSITARLPAGATSGPITVQTPGGTLTSASSFVVTTVVPGQAVAFQIDPAHDGVQTDAALNPPYALRWKTTFTNATGLVSADRGRQGVRHDVRREPLRARSDRRAHRVVADDGHVLVLRGGTTTPGRSSS